MISTFTTKSTAPATTGVGKSINWVIYLALAGAAVYLGYNYWWLPRQKAKEQEKK